MLLRQDGRRDQDRDLLSCRRRLKRGAQRNLSFSETNVAAD